ncbi:acyltransferase family protein [Actinoplanes rectilineatus]|uniref:acyltransferase family protein n=1 Tax=Actinoplanes rectilineatus TaxID=113571 RepID=UPI0005F28E69|nr:acyltransferase family protein [Actinoplanes rectilineatus]
MSVTYDSASEVTPTPAAPSRAGFRGDIEGLRAIAVVLVVAAHVGVPGFAGGYAGVDVFFVVSGFLITTLLLKELDRTGSISLGGFFARRIVRLLPAATLVLVATLAGAWLWLPPTRVPEISWDAAFAAFSGINWRLAYEGVQYLNADAVPSPLQHYWSLAVEEQFYLLWPLLILSVAVLFRRRGHHPRVPLVMILSVITGASLAMSGSLTSSWAYFGTHTRAWELAVGALVALSAAWPTVLPARLAAVLTWGGVAAIGLAAVLFDEDTHFPGTAALLPVLGTAAVIAVGIANPDDGAVRFLRRRPFQIIGRYSYGWYLWHWPLLMIGPAALGTTSSVWLGLLLAVIAFGLAAASYHLLEHPLRRMARWRERPRRGLWLGGGLIAASTVAALLAGLFAPAISTGAATTDAAKELAGSRDQEAQLRALIAQSTSLSDLPANLRPSITEAKADQPVVYADKCHLDYDATQVTSTSASCVYGVRDGEQTMVLFGDSHAAHWFPAVNTIAGQRGMRLLSLTKSACPAADAPVWNLGLDRPYPECTRWRESVFKEIARVKPAVVILSSNGGDGGGLLDATGKKPLTGTDSDQQWVAAWTKTFDRIKAAGARPVLIQDTPWPSGDVPDCLAGHADRVETCSRSVAKAIPSPARRALVTAAAKARGVTVVDPRPWFCTETVCPPIVGNVMVWKDDSHMSTAYAAVLAPLLAARLK